MKTYFISLIIGTIFGIILSTFILMLLMNDTQNKIKYDLGIVKNEIIQAEKFSK